MVVVALIFAVSVAVAAGAPAPEAMQVPYYLEDPYLNYNNPVPNRLRRSHIGYSSPCQAAHIPSYGSGYGHIHAVHAPVHHAYPQYGYPSYREDVGEEQQMMEFSDMSPMMSEQMPMARYAYGGAAASSQAGAGAGIGGAGIGGAGIAGLGGSSQVPGGPAVGVFPNAHVRGCNVPLLLSCSPSITAGHIVHSHPQSYGYASAGAGAGAAAGLGAGGYGAGAPHEGYRGTEESMATQESHRFDLTPTSQDQALPIHDMNTNLQ